MKHLPQLILLLSILLFTACDSPTPFGKEVKKEYFTNGQIRSEFIMDDSTGQNGLLKRYGTGGELTSTVTIRNGVKHGVETLYDPKGRILKTTPYYEGRKNGEEKGYFPSGDIWFSLPYVNGVLNGKAYIYRQDGTVVRKGIYRNGKLVN
jgi:antitoxin component YwqK of YwqJK toxin-antitoxin module